MEKIIKTLAIIMGICFGIWISIGYIIYGKEPIGIEILLLVALMLVPCSDWIGSNKCKKKCDGKCGCNKH